MADLERLDDLKAVTDEIARLKSWLDEAWGLRAKHEYDQVRDGPRPRAQAGRSDPRPDHRLQAAGAGVEARSVAEGDQRQDRAHPQDLAGDEREEEGAREGGAMSRGRARRVVDPRPLARVCSLALGAACATPPKPRELEALETLRATNQAKLPEVAKALPRSDRRGRPPGQRGPRRVAVERSRRIAEQRADGAGEAQDGDRALRSGSAEEPDPDALRAAGPGRGGVRRPLQGPGQRAGEGRLAAEVRRRPQDGGGRQAAAVPADVDRAAEGQGRAGQAVAAAGGAAEDRRGADGAADGRHRRSLAVRPRAVQRRGRSPGQVRGGPQAKRLRGRARPLPSPPRRAPTMPP